MNQLNQIIIEGTVAEKGEIRQGLHAKTCVLKVETTRSYRNLHGERETETSEFEVETWGTLSELCERKAETGRSIRVVGRLKQSRWKDSGGREQSKVLIVAEHIEFKNV